MYVENRTKIASFHTPRVFNASAYGVPLGIFVSSQGSQKTGVMGLSEGRKSFRICLAVLIQYRSVSDTQPATHPPSHVAVAVTLNALAKASSLKSAQRDAGCSKAEPKDFAPAQTPFPGVRDGQNLISWR